MKLSERSLRIFLGIAIVGAIASVAIHVAAIAGYDPVGNAAMILHVGIFVVWIPAVLAHLRQGRNWLLLIGGDRVLPKVGLVLLFAYTGFNFLASFDDRSGQVEFDGKEYLERRGREPPITITKEEYEHHQARLRRGFSGHWIFFYTMAA